MSLELVQPELCPDRSMAGDVLAEYCIDTKNYNKKDFSKKCDTALQLANDYKITNEMASFLSSNFVTESTQCIDSIKTQHNLALTEIWSEYYKDKDYPVFVRLLEEHKKFSTNIANVQTSLRNARVFLNV